MNAFCDLPKVLFPQSMNTFGQINAWSVFIEIDGSNCSSGDHLSSELPLGNTLLSGEKGAIEVAADISKEVVTKSDMGKPDEVSDSQAECSSILNENNSGQDRNDFGLAKLNNRFFKFFLFLQFFYFYNFF